MVDAKCPGQDSQYWKPQDVIEVPCPGCQAAIEFFKDEPKRKCHSCGYEVLNPRVDFGCALWCPKAVECIGSARYKTKKELLILEMEKYFGQDQKRINHAKKVLGYAEQLLEKEKADSLVVIASSVLHDIGIHKAESKHKSAAGNYQEIEGPPIARSIMEKLQLKKDVIDEVCQIIAHHHSPGKVNTLNFGVLYDADRLVNLKDEFDTSDREKLDKIIEKVFLTESGRELARKVYLQV